MSVAIAFDSQATVYTESPTTGQYTVQAKAALACRLSTISRKTAQSAAERTELAAMRMLYWDADYEMPANAQIEIAGNRWNVVNATDEAPTHPRTGQPVYQSCELMRVD